MVTEADVNYSRSFFIALHLDPTVTAVLAARGTIAVVFAGPQAGRAFQKQDDGETTNWLAISVGGAILTLGTFAAPVLVTAAGGITPGAQSVRIYIAGSGGPVDITAVPQIVAPSFEGQILELVGTSDVNTVLLEDGTGLAMNGAALMTASRVISFFGDKTANLWREQGRNF